MTDFRWTYLAHLGYNMWREPREDALGIHNRSKASSEFSFGADKLRFCDEYWHKLTQQLKEAGCNCILLDVGEGVKFESHPELAVEGSWSKEKLDSELSRLKGMGFEVIPKLNFSAGHDLWLGEYSRMLSTSIYYRVADDVIRETAELFGNPALFHLGMDEETYSHQDCHNYIVIRQGEQWWYDFNKLLDSTRKTGSRPWIWSDYGWRYEEEFFQNMPLDVLQSNWYYDGFEPIPDRDLIFYTFFDKLDRHGYDQIPTGSIWGRKGNFPMLVAYGDAHISREHLLGYMQTVWKPTLPETAPVHEDAMDDLKRAMEIHG